MVGLNCPQPNEPLSLRRSEIWNRFSQPPAGAAQQLIIMITAGHAQTINLEDKP
jgi:hypothetical protein